MNIYKLPKSHLGFSFFFGWGGGGVGGGGEGGGESEDIETGQLNYNFSNTWLCS